jgi:hypothetical protein
MSNYQFFIWLAVGLGGIFSSDWYIRRVFIRLGGPSVNQKTKPYGSWPPSGWIGWLRFLGEYVASLIGLFIFFKSNWLLAHAVLAVMFINLGRLAYLHRIKPVIALNPTRVEICGIAFSLSAFLLPLIWSLHVFLNHLYRAA